MKITLGLSLQFLALFFWWYGVVFLTSIAPLLGISLPYIPFTDFRGETYAWDFELMFTAIFLVWGWYLWRVARNPQEHLLFVDFTIAATIAHILAMLIVGFVRPEDLVHMVRDAVALSIPTVLLLYTRLRYLT